MSDVRGNQSTHGGGGGVEERGAGGAVSNGGCCSRGVLQVAALTAPCFKKKKKETNYPLKIPEKKSNFICTDAALDLWLKYMQRNKRNVL